MKRDDGMNMARYVEAARQYHDANPEAETALHKRHLESLGLSKEAVKTIVDEGMPNVAAHLSGNEDAAHDMRSLPTQGQSDAIRKLHAKLIGGKSSAETHDNEETDGYLAKREKGPASRR